MNEVKKIQFWNAHRIERFSKACFIALALSLLVVVVTGSDSPMLRHGDFPGFYAPAVIVSEGNIDKLYDLEYQRDVEGRYWQDFQDDFYIFAYPPYVARLLVPLAWFPPQLAKVFFMLCNFLCVVVAAWLLKRTFKDRVTGTHLYLLFLFPPLLTSIVGTQNSGLSFLLYTCVVTGLWRASERGDLVAGICSGLMCYKPQYGVFFILYLLASKNIGALIWSASTLFILYAIAAIDMGISWPYTWYQFASGFGDKNFVINAHQMVSLAGGAYSLFGEATAAKFFSVLLAVLYYARVFVSSQPLRHRSEKMLVSLALLGFVSTMLSPQTLYYDLSLCLVGLVLYLTITSDIVVTIYLTLCAVSGFIFLIRTPGGVSFYFLYALLLFVFFLMLLRRTWQERELTAQA